MAEETRVSSAIVKLNRKILYMLNSDSCVNGGPAEWVPYFGQEK